MNLAKNEISLAEAINHIKQSYEDQQQRGQSSPFFFIAGAGISYPPIPLAGMIEEECKALALKWGRSDPPANDAPIDIYSHWFQAAYPQRIERQTYLRGKIEGKPISHANFRLAHILLDGKIANLVVTPNFDDLLHRALRLFGKSPVICDHPKTVERIYHEQDQNDVRIVHVHGTYWFYDCANLRGEIEGRAEPATQPALTMEALLSKILADRSPIVVGYSGWEGDVIMSSLRRHLLSREPPFNLYWFCYKRSDIDRLPTWLKDRQEYQDVYFVVPQDDPPETAGDDISQDSFPQSHQDLGHEHEPTLSAQEVFDAFITGFDLPAPELTQKPLEYFAKTLRDSLPQDDKDHVKGEPYFFGSVIERIEKATANEGNIQMKIEKVRDAVRRSQYAQAALAAIGLPAANLTKTDLIDLLSVLKVTAPNRPIS